MTLESLLRRHVAKPVKKAIRGASEQWCPECSKHVPPFHVCLVRTDFKQRKARYDRARQTSGRRGSSDPHDYRSCEDQGCPRLRCRAFREGRESCPLPHQ